MWYCNLSPAMEWDEEEKLILAAFTHLKSFKVTPPYPHRFTGAPLLCCLKARQYFKVIFPMSNFTLGYARVKRMRAAIILNTCFRRYFFLSLCAFIPSWWSANEKTGRCNFPDIPMSIHEGLVSDGAFCLSSAWGSEAGCTSRAHG